MDSKTNKQSVVETANWGSEDSDEKDYGGAMFGTKMEFPHSERQSKPLSQTGSQFSQMPSSNMTKERRTTNSKNTQGLLQLIKLCFIGDKQVGKTAMILSLSDDGDKELPLMGDKGPESLVSRIMTEQAMRMLESQGSLRSPDTVSRIFKLPNCQNSIKAQFWDQANGTNMFPRAVADKAQGIVLVLDITDRETFDRVEVWNKRIT